MPTGIIAHTIIYKQTYFIFISATNDIILLVNIVPLQLTSKEKQNKNNGTISPSKYYMMNFGSLEIIAMNHTTQTFYS